MILSRTGVCKDVTDNNGTNGKEAKNGTFSILGWMICMVWRFGFWENCNTSNRNRFFSYKGSLGLGKDTMLLKEAPPL